MLKKLLIGFVEHIRTHPGMPGAILASTVLGLLCKWTSPGYSQIHNNTGLWFTIVLFILISYMLGSLGWQVDLIVTSWNGCSPGTADTIEKAKPANRSVYIYWKE
jgi:hypothetical protein